MNSPRTLGAATFLALAIALSLCAPRFAFSADLPPFRVESGYDMDAWLLLGPLDAETARSTETARQVLLSLEAPPTGNGAQVARIGQEPLRWYAAYAGADAWCAVDAQASPARRGDAAFLYRAVSGRAGTRLVLALGDNGPTDIFWNGAPLDGDTGWSPPGADRRFEVVTLREGSNHLLILTERPDLSAPWAVRLRLLDAVGFGETGVRYPHWRLAAPPPYEVGAPPEWIRWGARDVQEFLGLADASFTCLVRAEDGEEILEKTHLAGRPLALDWNGDSRSVLLYAEARIEPAQRADWAGVSLDAADASTPLPLGPPRSLPARTPGGADLSLPRSGRTQRDLLAAFEALGEPHVLRDNRNGVRLEALRGTLDYLLLHDGLLRKGPSPALWLQLALPSSEQDASVKTYALHLPERDDAAASLPLLVVAPPVGTDAWHVALRAPELTVATEEAGWAMAVANLDATASDQQWLTTTARIVEDLKERTAVDDARIYATAIGDAAPRFLAEALDRSGRFAALAFFAPEWRTVGWHRLAVSAHRMPLPPLFIAETPGAAPSPLTDEFARAEDAMRSELVGDDLSEASRAMIRFLGERRRDPGAPTRLEIVREHPGDGRQEWARLREALNWEWPARLGIEAGAGNLLRVSPENLASFDLLVDDIPGLDPARPLLLEMHAQEDTPPQRLTVIDRELPEAVHVEIVENDDRRYWAATETDRVAFQKPTKPLALGKVAEDLPGWPEGETGGVAGVLAQTAREATGARIAIVPALAVERGQRAGDLFLSDVCSWAPDAELSTASIPVAALRRAFERDYAGPRLLVTSGLNAATSLPDFEAEALQTDEAAGSAAAPGIFLSSSLDALTTEATIVAWTPLLAESERWLGLRPEEASPGDAPLPPGAFRVFPSAVTQRQALLASLRSDRVLTPPKRDAGPLPFKRAEIMKTKP